MLEIKIQIPEGYDGIDEEKSNFEEGRIVFKKKEATPWRYNKDALLSGYFVTDGKVEKADNLYNIENARDVFATKKQAESMYAMAQLSQIIQNDWRFGGPITDVEWLNHNVDKWLIDRYENQIYTDTYKICNFRFLAFHTKEQRDLFLEENKDLIRQYFMLD
jgi:hypothetical protein